jgi:hypothetical protein
MESRKTILSSVSGRRDPEFGTGSFGDAVRNVSEEMGGKGAGGLGERSW